MSGGCSLLLSLSASLLPRPQRCPSWAFLTSPSSHLVLEVGREGREAQTGFRIVTHGHSLQGASILTALRDPASLLIPRAAQVLFLIEVKFT